MTAQAQSRPASPTPKEVQIARESSRTLAAVLETRVETQQIELSTSTGETKPIVVPVSALRLFVEILTQIGSGNAVRIIPIHAELTTQEAADLLNVSRPFLIEALERNEIPYRKVGTHRRIKYEDVMAYKERIDAERKKSLDELAAQAQELKLGYE
jgi:excisionase family DNA binding protein